ncbi:hypothetical protein [Arabiibacter massiliensis]|uniref:hypothetical protein n=1 Tax=Arabiibacter massiliensis TaxID=1870985 RepID=UPI001E4F326B|nr:hypothetical protein [Arabiibacter massiliensis]
MRQQSGQSGVRRISGSTLFGLRRKVLEGAVPPLSDAAPAAAPVFGWVEKGLPTPATGGIYVVEFVGKNDALVLAYIDRYGRAFSTDVPFETPPAREPDLLFLHYEEQPTPGEERGCVEVREGGEGREVAQYRCARGAYTLFDSWFDFGPHAAGLSYNDVMARAYLAFVHRPALGAPAVPERGLGHVLGLLRAEKPLAAFRTVSAEVRAAASDPVCRPPALERCLAQWLSEAGLDELDARGVKDDALRLVRTTRYADTFYLAVEDEGARVPLRTVWALEAAVNRFLLVSEAFGENVPAATDIDCARWDAYLIEAAGMQRPRLGELSDAPDGAEGGEWAFRCAMGGAIERLRLPVRIDAVVDADVAAGVAALELTVPDGPFMPAWAWADAPQGAGAGSWAQPDEAAREAQARRYAMHLGLALAAAALEAAPTLRRVDVVARPFVEPPAKAEGAAAGEFPGLETRPAWYRASFDRAAFEATQGFDAARAGDPAPLFASCGTRFDVADADAFAALKPLPSAASRVDLPEAAEVALGEEAAYVLGAESCAELRISYDTALRRRAEGLADEVVRAESASAAIRIVRAEQERAEAADDDRAREACTRLMAALAEGEVDAGDQNAVVGRFLGDDRCLPALARARALAQHDPGQAADVLIDAVVEAAALDGFSDGAATVYRTFDSYAGRMLYNRARRDGQGAPERAHADAGKRVLMATDSFYLCHLEIVRLLEHSFERADDAQRFGLRAVEMAPATAAGFRQLGRAYMLVGDMENAAEVLVEGLRIAVQPSDISMAYYQLAYVLWKAGRPEPGAACYLKSLMVSQVIALQATAELQELVEETGVALVERAQVDSELARFGIPVAPTEDVLEALGSGAAAAVDEGLFPVARNLLALRLRYRPDDALVNVMRSLEVSTR